MKTMKYETSELTTLTPAINAIQATTNKDNPGPLDIVNATHNEMNGAYEDWE